MTSFTTMTNSNTTANNVEALKAEVRTVSVGFYNLLQKGHIIILRNAQSLDSADNLIIEIIEAYGQGGDVAAAYIAALMDIIDSELDMVTPLYA